VAAADQQVVHRVRRHRIIGPEAFDVPADRRTSVVRKTPVTFYSEGVRLVGDIYYPDDLGPSERRAGIVLCHGYTGVKDLYLPDNARVLTEAGYVVMTFDYKGWGDSGGARSRLAPYSRVADAQAALTFLETLPEVDAQRLGIYGTSYGGATVVWTGDRSAGEVRRQRGGHRGRRALDAQRPPARRVPRPAAAGGAGPQGARAGRHVGVRQA
jgi:dipeptidyl aminopeptidase/acylaminoacyl peptidase